MAHISNFAPVADVAADVAQFLSAWNPLCLRSASQSTGIIRNLSESYKCVIAKSELGGAI